MHKHLSFANVMSMIAVAIALGGTSYAALKLPKNSVGSNQIKKNAVTRIATDLDPKELPPGLPRDEFLAKLVPPAPAPSHSKGAAGLVGLFVKPQ